MYGDTICAFGDTICAFGSKEWGKGKILRKNFLRSKFQRKNLRIVTSTRTSFSIRMHEERY